MVITIYPGKLSGTVAAIPSKSQAHRLLICASLSNEETVLTCAQTNEDINATARCLYQIFRNVKPIPGGYRIIPTLHDPRTYSEPLILDCGESGSTFRFLLPLVGALGVPAVFKLSGRLSQRPLSPLWEEMERTGCRLNWISHNELCLDGQLHAGQFILDGGVSSQFITGLLFAASLLDGDSQICIRGELESEPYVQMTRKAMALFGVDTAGFRVKGRQKYKSPGVIPVEGDWSNGAFFLAAEALGSKITVTGLDPKSAQGDRAVVALLQQLKDRCTVSAAQIPDLIPVLSIVAAANNGAVFTDIGRLRLKESDRVDAIVSMIRSLGGDAFAQGNILTVRGTGLTGGTVNSRNDHRIAMSAAIAATVCRESVHILGAQCVSKSYPGFWDDYKHLGGNYEQHLR